MNRFQVSGFRCQQRTGFGCKVSGFNNWGIQELIDFGFRTVDLDRPRTRPRHSADNLLNLIFLDYDDEDDLSKTEARNSIPVICHQSSVFCRLFPDT
jgi:hypothetical protein